tara:strand:+ start:821 stop:1141 length:321 start_codon:yes stop_codon:yes gene_type:complete
MIITITKDDGTVTSWDTNNITDDSVKMDANVIIRKVEILGVVAEGLQYSSDTYRNNLTMLLQNRDEAIVDTPTSEVVETPTEDGGATSDDSVEGMTEDNSSTEEES